MSHSPHDVVRSRAALEVHVVEVGRCSSQPLSHSLRYGRSRRSGAETGSGRDGLNGTEEQAAWDFIVSRFDLIWVKCKQNPAEKLRHSDIYITHTPADRWNYDPPRYADDTFTPHKNTIFDIYVYFDYILIKTVILWKITSQKIIHIYLTPWIFLGYPLPSSGVFRPGRAMTEPGQARPMLLGEKKMHVPKPIYKYICTLYAYRYCPLKGV